MLPLLRFTLDLFESASERGTQLAVPTAVPVPPAAPVAPVEPVAPYVAGEALQDAIAPAHFSHPQANRETRIGGAVVAYQFVRCKRRTIGFVVGPNGLAVRAPRWTPLYEVEAAIQEKGDWILRKLQETRDRHQRQDQARIVWADGVLLPFLGKSVEVVLDPTHGFPGKGSQLVPSLDAREPHLLRVGLPKAASADQIRDAVQAWLMQQAFANFKDRMDHFAPLLQVQWRKLRLSSAGSRWGSASADGSIRLNWKLIHFRQPVIDYVVAHELSHLRVMNHSATFWDTVATVVPDYADLRKQLKSDAAPRW